VCVERALAVAVVEHDEEAVAALTPVGVDDTTVARRVDRRSRRRDQVDAGMEAVTAWAERVAEPSLRQRPSQRQDDATRRPLQRGKRRRPRHPVGRQAGPALEPP
jgi:hypothetical protein